MEMLLLMVVFIGLMYVLMVLPQKKKMDAQRKMLSALQPGARVMLNTGMFGTLRATGEQQMVVELAPGVEVTVLKQAVVRAVTAQEEEFEYSDGDQTIEPADEFSADVLEPLAVPESEPAPVDGADRPASPETEAPSPRPSFELSAQDPNAPLSDEDDRPQNR